MVAGDEHDLARRGRARCPIARRTGRRARAPRARGRGAARAGRPGRRGGRRRRARRPAASSASATAQHVDPRPGAEVQVRDHERPHEVGRLPCPPVATHALDGILVADMSRVLAGPLCAMTLGDLGADVVKVERPDGGDDTRAWGPPFVDGGLDLLPRAEPQQALGRRSISRTPATVALARELCSRADVVIESFRPGTIDRLGLGYDARSAPRTRGVVYCSVSAFGAGEAAAALPGYDLLLQAMSGLMSVTGEPDGRPLKVGAALIDMLCGLHASVGILAALRARERDGLGQRVEASLMDSALAALLNQASAYLTPATVPGRHAATATRDRPLRDLRGRRRRLRARGRQRHDVRAAVRGHRPARAGGRRALRDERRAPGAPRRARRRCSNESFATAPAAEWAQRLRRGRRARRARSTTSRRRSRFAEAARPRARRRDRRRAHGAPRGAAVAHARATCAGARRAWASTTRTSARGSRLTGTRRVRAQPALGRAQRDRPSRGQREPRDAVGARARGAAGAAHGGSRDRQRMPGDDEPHRRLDPPAGVAGAEMQAAHGRGHERHELGVAGPVGRLRAAGR